MAKNEKSDKKKSDPPLFVEVKTSQGNKITVRQITSEEIERLRNPAYKYLL